MKPQRGEAFVFLPHDEPIGKKIREIRINKTMQIMALMTPLPLPQSRYGLLVGWLYPDDIYKFSWLDEFFKISYHGALLVPELCYNCHL